MVLRKSFYIRWSAGRSPRVHEVNPGRDPSIDVRPRCYTELVQVRSARPVQDLTTYDLQLQKVITPSSELRFGCSWTLWKAHGVKNSSIDSLIKLELILKSENQS